jgi:hypothetical protein
MPTKHTHVDNQRRIKTPHKFRDGKYVVSDTKYEKDYKRVGTLEEVDKAVSEGKGVRVSEGGNGSRPSFVKPARD